MKKIEETENGWSKWIVPPADKAFAFTCCDCGLTHDFEFGTVNLARGSKDGSVKIKHVESERPIFRTKINKSKTELIRLKPDGESN